MYVSMYACKCMCSANNVFVAVLEYVVQHEHACVLLFAGGAIHVGWICSVRLKCVLRRRRRWNAPHRTQRLWPAVAPLAVADYFYASVAAFSVWWRASQNIRRHGVTVARPFHIRVLTAGEESARVWFSGCWHIKNEAARVWISSCFGFLAVDR